MRKGDPDSDEADLELCQQVADIFRAISGVQMHRFAEPFPKKA